MAESEQCNERNALQTIAQLAVKLGETLDMMEETDIQQLRRSSEPQPVAADSINLSGSRKPAEMNELRLIQQLKTLKAKNIGCDDGPAHNAPAAVMSSGDSSGTTEDHAEFEGKAVLQPQQLRQGRGDSEAASRSV
ncbi:hypothetical protein BOX15_Mlig007613g1 [Macrostomum lignano]|uniref:Uncharacterized protein n=1 Tax=Macrostomum lignano TaxID=282301 RepID=A0A267EWW0_9PLAT|nr:hypothetical protein BOX15_Mlig007613g1 [Macrostomum lignano]